MASRTVAPGPAPVIMPTSSDFFVSERRLAKTTRNDRYAETCMRGQILGGTEIHLAMNFPPVARPATEENPGWARAHANTANGVEKVLVLESKDPTVWDVTGKPSAVILLGQAVIRDVPEGVRIFAPRFASGCKNNRWIKLPKSWTLPAQQSFMDSLADNLNSRFARRAKTVSTKMFNRPYASWRVQRGATVMTF